jgi:hypothetical protein
MLGIVENEVGGDYLLGRVQVTLVEEFFDRNDVQWLCSLAPWLLLLSDPHAWWIMVHSTEEQPSAQVNAAHPPLGTISLNVMQLFLDANFGELRTGEVSRISPSRGWVHKELLVQLLTLRRSLGAQPQRDVIVLPAIVAPVYETLDTSSQRLECTDEGSRSIWMVRRFTVILTGYGRL